MGYELLFPAFTRLLLQQAAGLGLALCYLISNVSTGRQKAKSDPVNTWSLQHYQFNLNKDFA
ncbi:hypothetical protein [Azohydromonas aeria]|uniref:hypothetical protein n=1 Tax=Azohydromonas aeria TaxID=2590212 RepID=UPI0012FC7B30|nr:hypothetical protein [Azohydromonas aeria]